jgi:aldose 1-epimerase
MADASGASGAQIVLRHNDQQATIVEVGGGIREYRCGERPLLDGYALDEMCPAAHGQPLVPWPNRIGGGRYRFAGKELQVPLTEPARGNAIHGLLRWVEWRPADRAVNRVTMQARVHPQPGYPFDLGVEIEYALDDEGLRATWRAVNLGGGPLPFGAGQHPYLWPGGRGVDGARLRLPAGVVLEMNERSIPVGRHEVDSELDFSTPRELEGVVLDHCFTDVARDPDGRCTVDLIQDDGMVTRLWMDGGWSWIQVFSGDALGAPLARRGVAIEPMTCPPNAFQTGESLIVLEPGQRFQATWGLGLMPA